MRAMLVAALVGGMSGAAVAGSLDWLHDVGKPTTPQFVPLEEQKAPEFLSFRMQGATVRSAPVAPPAIETFYGDYREQLFSAGYGPAAWGSYILPELDCNATERRCSAFWHRGDQTVRVVTKVLAMPWGGHRLVVVSTEVQ
jgi:hypothetical protein